jgi:hypothetical protein
MLKRLASILILAFVLILIGCKQKDDDVALIKQVLDDSKYTAESTTAATDDSSSTPSQEKSPDSIISWVRWARRIERPVTRQIDVTVTGDSAVATITALLTGTPPNYGFFVRNLTDSTRIHVRAISDSTRRLVKLYKGPNGWRIVAVTACDMQTVNGYAPIAINEVKAEVASRNYIFSLTSPTKFIAKESLPIFLLNDTIIVTVTATVTGDSAWAFLHRGILGLRIRRPFFKTGTNTFTRTWIVPEDAVTPPAVRHSAFDVIGWQTLFGDSMATYSSRAWGLPYIIKRTTDTIPE